MGESYELEQRIRSLRGNGYNLEKGIGVIAMNYCKVNADWQLIVHKKCQLLQPLSEVYSVLHSFAQSLQLDVLCCQASRVINGQMRQYALIERYDHKEGVLIIAYWLKRTQHNRSLFCFYIYGNEGIAKSDDVLSHVMNKFDLFLIIFFIRPCGYGVISLMQHN